MKIKTRIFDIASEKGMAISALASAMGVHPTLLYRVRAGERGINDAFIEGAKRAFPDKSLDELFVVGDEPAAVA